MIQTKEPALRDAVPCPQRTSRIGIITGLVSSQGQKSLCANCFNCSCDWVHIGKPVDGWTAEPSKIYCKGWAVSKCPEFAPFPIRKNDHAEVHVDFRKRCKICGASLPRMRRTYCSDACYRKGMRLKDMERIKKKGNPAECGPSEHPEVVWIEL